jgi:hypothetical protein
MSNTVVERLIESWLDSQTERRYQPAFIQLLVSEGWTVLHNTRHSPIELGKDVIARNLAGKLFCFQLKGNPGGRITKTEAQGLLPQVLELIHLPPPRSFRVSDDEKHVAVLVTNGEVDEEARLVFDGAGEQAGKAGVPAESFELWTRGTLLKKLVNKAGTVWPSTITGSRRILELMASTGEETPKPTDVADVLSAAAPPPKDSLTAPAKTAAITSLFLIAEIVKSPWYRTNNHFALYSISVIASTFALLFADSRPRRTLVEAYAALSLEHCADLLNEAQKRGFDPSKVWAESDPLSEFDILWERRRLVADAAATLVLARADGDVERASLARLLEQTCTAPKLWGLAAFPALITRTWARRRLNPTLAVEGDFARHLSALLSIQLGLSPNRPPLASPYYGFEDVWADQFQMPFFTDNSIGRDNFARRAWGLRAAYYMLAKRNLKQTCKLLWGRFSKLIHEEPELPTQAFFCPTLAREGKMLSITFFGSSWSELVDEAVRLGEVPALEPFSELAWLIAAYVALVPYRASSAVLLWLDTKLNRTWYNSSHLPA